MVDHEGQLERVNNELKSGKQVWFKSAGWVEVEEMKSHMMRGTVPITPGKVSVGGSEPGYSNGIGKAGHYSHLEKEYGEGARMIGSF